MIENIYPPNLADANSRILRKKPYMNDRRSGISGAVNFLPKQEESKMTENEKPDTGTLNSLDVSDPKNAAADNEVADFEFMLLNQECAEIKERYERLKIRNAKRYVERHFAAAPLSVHDDRKRRYLSLRDDFFNEQEEVLAGYLRLLERMIALENFWNEEKNRKEKTDDC